MKQRAGVSEMDIIDLLANDNYVIANKTVAKTYGLEEAILLGELASEYKYWARREELKDGYFYSTIEKAKHKPHGNYGTVYCLTNFGSTMEDNLYRIYTLRDMGFRPYVMIYDKPNSPREIRDLQRWCNNIKIFRSCPDFRDYKKGSDGVGE